MKLLPTTIESWNAKKRLFMRLLTKEPDPEQAEVYENAVNYCDRKIGQVHKVSKMLVIVLTCLILAISGCYSIHGFGKDLSTWSSPYIENAER